MTPDLGRILVTGANGQLGTGLIRRLASEGPETSVRAVVRSRRAAEALRAACGDACETRILDYADGDALGEAARGCRFAVHLVGIIKETASSRYADAHEATSASLARAADAAGLERIVYLSILGVDAASTNACLASKGAAENALLGAKTPAVVLRVPMVLGPDDRTARILRSEAGARVLPMVGGGRSRAQPIWVGDVIDAILAACTRPGLEDTVLELAGPESLPARELVARVAATVGSRGPAVLPVPRGLVRLAAALAARLAHDPPLTPTMLDVILLDDCIDPEPARDRLGIALTPLDETLRRCYASAGAER